MVIVDNIDFLKKCSHVYESFNYIINPLAFNKIKILVPELSALDYRDEVIIDGIKYLVNNGQDLPRADITLGYSVPGFRGNVTSASRVTFSFLEYFKKQDDLVDMSNINDNHSWISIHSGPKNA